jgi:hypothetical protein
MRVYTRMRRGDGAVNTSLLAIEKPILGARWDVAGDDDLAQACRDELFSSDRAQPWDPPILEQAVEHLLGMFQYGFAACEPIWEIGDDGNVHCTRITRIRQESVRTIRLDTREQPEVLIQYTNQLDGGWREIEVPINQLMLAVHAREGADYTGVALIRSSYRAFLERDTIRKTRLWHHDRFGAGTPTAEYPENAGDDAKRDVDEALENWRSGTKTFIAVPFGTKLDVKGGQSMTGTGPVEELASLAAEIAKNTLSQLTEFGTSGNTGNRSLGTSFAELLRQALQGYAERVAQIIRRKLLMPFVRWNFGETVDVPELTVRVSLAGVTELLSAITMATAAGLTLEPEDIAAIRDELELPEIELEELTRRIEQRRLDAQKTKTAIDAKTDPKTDPKSDPTKEPKQLDDPPPAPMLAPDYLGRFRPAKIVGLEEKFVKPRLLGDQLDREATRATADVHDVLRDIDRDLAAQVRGFAEQGADVLTAKVAKLAVPNALRIRLRRAMDTAAERARNVGAESVREELQRQGLERAAEKTLAERLRRLFADREFFGGFRRMMRSMLDLFVDREITAREQGAQDAALAAVTDGARASVPADAAAIAARVKAMLEERSVSAVESRVTSVINVSFGQGRSETGQLFGQEIDTQIRSEVLDGNTCDWCSEHDGDEFDFGDPNAPELPDPNCDGQWRCRGFWFYQLKTPAGA